MISLSRRLIKLGSKFSTIKTTTVTRIESYSDIYLQIPRKFSEGYFFQFQDFLYMTEKSCDLKKHVWNI